MVLVHAFVAEVLAYFVHAFESAHYQSLEVKLRGDAHVHVHVERVEVGDEGAGGGTAGYDLQRGSLHFGVAGLVEEAAHDAQHGGSLLEGLLHALVHHEVHVSLAGSHLGVVKLVIGHAVLVFHDGQGLQALAQERETLGVDGYLAHLGAEDVAFHADEVAYVEQLLEHFVV